MENSFKFIIFARNSKNMNPMEDEVKEIKLWFPVANRYNSSGNIDYRFPQLTERITNSPSEQNLMNL